MKLTKFKDECSICDGKGYIEDYDDRWKCRACNGTGNADGLEDDGTDPEKDEDNA